jgi:hypothetical protein
MIQLIICMIRCIFSGQKQKTLTEDKTTITNVCKSFPMFIWYICPKYAT